MFDPRLVDRGLLPAERRDPRDDHSPTETISRARMERIYQAHQPTFGALTDLRRAGHTVIFHPGNHDPESAFAGVQEDLLHYLGGPDLPGRALLEVGPVMVGDVMAWHGHWQDPINRVEWPMYPFQRDPHTDELRLRPSTGDLAISLLWNGFRETLPEGLRPRTVADWAAWAKTVRRALPEVRTFLGDRLREHLNELLGSAAASRVAHQARLDALVSDARVELINRNRVRLGLRPASRREIVETIGRLVDAGHPRLPVTWDGRSMFTDWVKRVVFDHLLAQPSLDLSASHAVARELGANVMLNGHTHIAGLQQSPDGVVVNTGTTVNAKPKKRDRIPFAHIMLRKDGTASRARLMRFDGGAKRSKRLRVRAEARIPKPLSRSAPARLRGLSPLRSTVLRWHRQ
jgi:hypothetical protein